MLWQSASFWPFAIRAVGMWQDNLGQLVIIARWMWCDDADDDGDDVSATADVIQNYPVKAYVLFSHSRNIHFEKRTFHKYFRAGLLSAPLQVKTTRYWLPFPPSVFTSSAQRCQDPTICATLLIPKMNFGFPFGHIKFYHSAVRWLAFDDLDQNPDEDVFYRAWVGVGTFFFKNNSPGCWSWWSLIIFGGS